MASTPHIENDLTISKKWRSSTKMMPQLPHYTNPNIVVMNNSIGNLFTTGSIIITATCESTCLHTTSHVKSVNRFALSSDSTTTMSWYYSAISYADGELIVFYHNNIYFTVNNTSTVANTIFLANIQSQLQRRKRSREVL